ncbi:MAG: DUF1416 domain-containing protein [Candidatus Dormibacteraeota bacterium]|nr:DUF1416 domain-containing protein [Candidatus Dormibacteraeota bacterium]
MRLHGRVRREGEPVEGAYVQLIGPSGEFTAEARTDEGGRFLFYPVPGTWILRGVLPGGRRLEQPVTLVAGQNVEIELRLAVDGPEQTSESKAS